MLQASDELAPLEFSVAVKHKIRSCCFAPSGARRKQGLVTQLALALTNNSIEVVDVKEDSFEVIYLN